MKDTHKKIIIPTLVLVFLQLFVLAGSLFPVESPSSLSKTLGDERKRIFLIAGGGYSTKKIEGGNFEVGAEVRLFGRIFARLIFDYYDNDSSRITDGWRANYSAGANLYAVGKIRLSDTVDFYIKAGGHYSALKTTTTAYGITYQDTSLYHGFCGGLGLQVQLGNRWYVYVGGKAKHILTDDPWTWFNIDGGFLYRIR